MWAEVFAGSEIEEYVRLLQISGLTNPYPWSVRSFGPEDLRRLSPAASGHPWAEHYDPEPDTLSSAFTLIAPTVTGVLNSAFPYGSNDGPVWAGKGLTGSLTAGFAVHYRALTAIVAPTFIAAQNAGFELTPNGLSGDSVFRDFRNPREIDLPQRPGDGAFANVDPGQSTVRVDYAGLAAGFSTANQHWGPAREYPVILGNNAAGFPHVFVGTSLPRDLWVGTLHGRVMWGSLAQSEYSPMEDGDQRRLMTGFIATFSPRVPSGLEVGIGRFYHIAWPEEGVGTDEIRRPFETFFKRNIPQADQRAENQLASVHARWALPEAGFELYGEFGREDHNHDLRDLILEPDHISAYVLGFQRVWRQDDERWWVLGGEVTNSEVSHLQRVRPQAPFYLHGLLRQGHTQKGQLLGSPAVYGGSGSILSIGHYHPGGRVSFFVERTLRGEPSGVTDPDSGGPRLDVQLSSGVESISFWRNLEISGGVSGILNLNRGYSRDVFNLNARLGVAARM